MAHKLSLVSIYLGNQRGGWTSQGSQAKPGVLGVGGKTKLDKGGGN